MGAFRTPSLWGGVRHHLPVYKTSTHPPTTHPPPPPTTQRLPKIGLKLLNKNLAQSSAKPDNTCPPPTPDPPWRGVQQPQPTHPLKPQTPGDHTNVEISPEGLNLPAVFGTNSSNLLLIFGFQPICPRTCLNLGVA